MYPEKSPSVAIIANNLLELREMKKKCSELMAAWKAQVVQKISFDLSEYQKNSNELNLREKGLKKDESELDTKITNYNNTIKGQKMLMQSASGFLMDYGKSVESNKNVSHELFNELQSSEKETENYKQSNFCEDTENI